MKVLQGQTLIDIAIQELGSAEGAYGLAALNGLSVTDELVPGLELQLPTVTNKSISDYYTNKGIKPATYITANTILPENEGGVEFWAIETEFLVS